MTTRPGSHMSEHWQRMHGALRRKATSLQRGMVPMEPGTYAWYRSGDPTYVGATDELRETLWGGHLSMSPSLAGYAFPRVVAQHLGIAKADDVKTMAYRLQKEDVTAIREFIDSCEVAWIVAEGIDEARQLEAALKDAWDSVLLDQV